MWERGQLVWANVAYPNSWLPGVVLDPDEPDIGIIVSFFNLQQPRYFVHPQLRFFSSHFKSLVQTTPGFPDFLGGSPGTRILNCALRSLSRNVAHDLWCICQPPIRSRGDGARTDRVLRRNRVYSSLFRTDDALGFVRRAAVLPWVELEDFADAALRCSEILSFRRYSFDYERSKAMNEEISATPEEDRAHSRRQEHASETMHGDQPNNKQRNLMALLETHREMLIKLQFLAVDPFYPGRANLDTVNFEVLNLRALLLQDISCCRSKEHPVVEDNEVEFSDARKDVKDGVGDISLPAVTCGKSSIMYRGPKRRLEFDHFAPSGSFLKVCKSIVHSTNGASAHLSNFRARSQPNTSNPSISLISFTSTLFWEVFNTYLQRLRSGYKADSLVAAFRYGRQINLMMENINTNQTRSLTFTCNSNLLELMHDIGEIFMSKNTSRFAKLAGFGRVQELQRKFHSLNDYGISTSNASKEGPESNLMILKDDGAHDAAENGAPINTVGYMQENCYVTSLPHCIAESESAPTSLVGAPDDIVSSNDGSSTSAEQLSHSQMATDQTKLQINSGDNVTSIRTKRKANDSEESKNSLKKNKVAQQHVSSDLPFNPNSQAAQNHQGTSFASSKSLHMKFLRNCSLPSKGDLVKKFSVFGRIDSPRTKVYTYTASARVVFMDNIDAVAAYQYAKRQKVVSGQPNVLYWLDPFEQYREGTKVSMLPKPEEPAPKSCLKAVNSGEKEAKRRGFRVRFRMETSK